MATDPTTFSLAGQGLKLDDVASLTPHITSLESPSTAAKIITLNLSGNTIGVPAALHLSTLLPSLSNLETASLADIFTSRLLSEIPQALDALLTALLQCPKLVTINLSDNAFGLKTAAPLVKYLSKATSLQHLILNNNGLGPEAGKLVATALAELADAKKTAGGDSLLLQTLVCGRNRLENGSAAAWAAALHKHAACLREVRLSQNGIRVEGMSAILEGLRGAHGLEVLDVQDNLLTVPGAKALAGVLQGWGSLRELQVSDTLMRGRGGVVLAETLAKGSNESLEVLRCQYNEVDAGGVKALVDAVEKGALPKLRRVEVNGNRFEEDDPAIERLAEVLRDRKEKAGVEDDLSEDWGLDELDELEDVSDGGDEEPEDEDDETEEKANKELQQADEAEGENVAQEKDADVDALADKLGKTEL